MPDRDETSPDRREAMDSWPVWPERVILNERNHRCAAMAEQERIRGRREADAAARNEVPGELLYGRLVERIDHAAGRWWAHNNEFSSEIRFCPFCGVHLETLSNPDGEPNPP